MGVALRNWDKVKLHYLAAYFCWLIVIFLAACDGENVGQSLAGSSPTSPTKAIATLNPTVSSVTSSAADPTFGPQATPASSEVVVSLDYSKTGPAISPYIYGIADLDKTDATYIAGLRPSMLRWGGNSASRFNWVLGNAWNAGRDFQFENGNYGQPTGDVATASFQRAIDAKIAMLVTVPMLGWVAKNSDTNIRSVGVPDQGGPPVAPNSEAIVGYNPEANRALTSLPSQARKNGPFVDKPDPASSTVVYQDEWVASLVKKFGPAQAGGIKFYAMDNEPDLWSETHTDVHPTRVGYDELWSRFQDYASAIKNVDTTAMITGPVSWGWIGYFYSALDRGSDNFKTGNDRANHGNQPFIPWFLSQARQYEQQKGKKILDVLDIHYYPSAEGVYAGKTDSETNAKRLRATRSLWDLSYIDESWIGAQIKLLPRMQDWIKTYYPGVKLGISEWNFGADTTLNGALAISQALGIFGSQDVYMASYWPYPPKDSPGYEAFRLYTNFDGKGSSFGNKSIPVKVSDDLKVSSFGAIDSSNGHLHLILINLQPDKDQPLRVQTLQNLPDQNAAVYQISAKTGNQLTQQPLMKLAGGSKIELTLPAYSITLLDLLPASNQ